MKPIISQTDTIKDCPPAVARPRGNDLLERITGYLDAHLAERITLQDVAGMFDVSISTVTQLFQKRTDTTLHQYLTRRRMEAAQHLIRGGTPLEAVGKQVGYTDHSTFYRAFKQAYGISPREYRRRENKKG